MTRKTVTSTLVFLPLFATLLALGIWQVQRLHWKTTLIAQITAGLNAPAEALQSETPPEFYHVKAAGRLLNDKPLFVYGRTKDGNAGVHVFTALQRADGPPLIVDRGFVKLPIDPAKGTAPSTGQIDGIVRLSSGKAWFDPPNDRARNQWYWPDLPAMAKAIGVGAPEPFYIEAITPTAQDGPKPTGADILPNIRNEHLQYAITWFSLAGVLAVIYGMSLRGKG